MIYEPSSIHFDDIDPIETQRVARINRFRAGPAWPWAERTYLLKQDDRLCSPVRERICLTAPNTAYLNTIAASRQPEYPGDPHDRTSSGGVSYAGMRWRWSCRRIAKTARSLAGISRVIASSATLYEVGFNHFWRAPSEQSHLGDLVFMQGHSSPGVYARAYLEGRH